MSTQRTAPLMDPPAGDEVPRGVSRPDRGLVQGSEVFADAVLALNALTAAAFWLERQRSNDSLHLTTVGTQQTKAWIEAPLKDLAEVVTSQRGLAGLARVREQLMADLQGSTVVTTALHPATALGRWWFAPTLDEVVQVDGWDEVGAGLCELDAVLLVASARAQGEADETVVSALGEILAEGWHPQERAALVPVWGANRHLRPSTVLLLALLHAWQRQQLESGPGTLERQLGRDVQELFEHLAPRGSIDLSGADERVWVARVEGDSGCERAVAAVDNAMDRTHHRSAAQGSRRRTAALVTSAAALWVGATWGLDPALMNDLGLVSILRPSGYLAVILLLIAFVAELGSARPSNGRLVTPVVALVVLLHGTPSWLYGELRYSWAWKHLGVVDFISRTGTVDPSVPTMDIYHSWPGFFSINSTVVGLLGLDTAAGYARWWPVMANLAVIPVLLLVYRGLGGTAGRRTAWLAVMIFLAANWIGQDYFSPQSLAYLLYLLIIGVVLQFTAHDRGLASEGATRPGRWSVAIAIVATAALVTSHQITPVVLLLALGALILLRQRRVVLLASGVAAMAVLWAATGAWSYMNENLSALLDGFGDPAANADGNLVDQGSLSTAQQLVSTAGRLVLLLVAVLAVLGFLRQVRGRKVDLTAVALILAPAGLLFANSFGGEIGFRTYLFALPFLAWYAALAIWPTPAGATVEPQLRTVAAVRRRQGAVIVVGVLLLAGFSFGYYGKDAYYQFASDEVAASEFILDNARDETLLVTVTSNYPGLWRNYERVTPVPISREPGESIRAALDDPVTTMERWLGGDGYAAGYILLTRSQEREVEALGDLPTGAYADLRRTLDASPRFKTVWASANARIYQLADRSPDLPDGLVTRLRGGP